MAQVHSFSVPVACVVGERAAVFLNYFSFWHIQNRANGKNFRNGHYWTYNTLAAFCEVFPYLTTKQVRIALEKLETDGFILTGNYNKEARDRTTWYALTQIGCELVGIESKVSSHLPNSANGVAQNGKCNSPEGQTDLPGPANGIAQNGNSIYKETVRDNTVRDTVKDDVDDEAAKGKIEKINPFETLTSTTPQVAPAPPSLTETLTETLKQHEATLLNDTEWIHFSGRSLSLTPEQFKDYAGRFFAKMIADGVERCRVYSEAKSYCYNWIQNKISRNGNPNEQRTNNGQSSTGNNRPGKAKRLGIVSDDELYNQIQKRQDGW